MIRRLAVFLMAAALTFAAAIDRNKLKQIRPALERGTMAGAAALIAVDDQVVAFETTGWQDVDQHKPMRRDTIVQVMSQTKSVTAVAAMMLVDEGKLDVTRPIEFYLPEFKGQMVEEKLPDGSVRRHPPAHPPTVAEALSHTAGFPFLPAKELNRVNYTLHVTLAEAIPVYGREPLSWEPGTKYNYSNMGIATVGRIIEVLSGKEYSRFVEERLLTPLGMKDSFYFPPAGKTSRIAMVYKHKDGKLYRETDLQGGDTAKFRAGMKYAGPELALFSTADDLLHFYQMLLNGGVYKGRRYLSTRSLAAIATDHTPGHTGYGFGFALANSEGVKNYHVSPGSFGHGGAFGTYGWVDPQKHMVILFLTQMLDNSSNTPRREVFQIAEDAVQ